MRIVSLEDCKRWSTLTIDRETGFPCFVVRSDVVSNFPYPHRFQYISTIRQILRLTGEKFVFHEGPESGFFGFGDSLRKSVNSDGNVVYHSRLPIIHELSTLPCPDCNGTGEDEFDDTMGLPLIKCGRCHGTGKRSDIDWSTAYALSASIVCLTNLLFLAGRSVVSGLSKNDPVQLLVLNVISAPGNEGCSLGGYFSPRLMHFLLTHRASYQFEEVRNAMIRVYEYMWRTVSPEKKRSLNGGIGAWQSTPGYLMLDVPGNASGIHLSGHYNREQGGAKFTCHNVNTPLQQLVLITGLAALCDLYEEKVNSGAST